MPSGSSVRLSGWDGLLEVERGNAWVPSGVSGWEFSCGKKITSKANDDYEKRTANPLSLNKDYRHISCSSLRADGTGKKQWEREPS